MDITYSLRGKYIILSWGGGIYMGYVGEADGTLILMEIKGKENQIFNLSNHRFEHLEVISKPKETE